MQLFIKQNKNIYAIIILLHTFYSPSFCQGTEQQIYLSAGYDFSKNMLAGNIKPLSYSTYSAGFQLKSKRSGAGFSIEQQRNYRISEYNWIGWGDVKQTEHYTCTYLRLLYAINTKIGQFIPQIGCAYIVGHVKTKSANPDLNMYLNSSYAFKATISTTLHIKYMYGLNSKLSIGGVYNHILSLPDRFPYMKKTIQFVILHNIKL
ncbi:MAG: hypothetical protein EBV15_02385 [Bacteroidetes bacterium]|nr:hypothetical protein [Bacteroidota bacterium]